jgi:hypothetical protein
MSRQVRCRRSGSLASARARKASSAGGRLGDALADRRHRLVHLLVQHRQRVGAEERRLPGDHLEQHHASA